MSGATKINILNNEKTDALNNKKSLKPSDFKDDPRVKACVDQIIKNPKVVSDVVSEVLDDKLNKKTVQYVNLVQKGGGVLGIALVGYTYILEQANIRFLKLAGTSAGAINTSLMVIDGEKDQPKSDFLLKALADLDLFKLVDGHPFAKFVIKQFVKKPDFLARLQKLARNILLTLILLLSLCFVFLGLQSQYRKISEFTCAFFVFTGFYFLFLVMIAVYFASLFKRLKDSGFGINPGDYFYTWIKDHMKEKGVQTVTDLISKAETIPKLYHRDLKGTDVSDLNGEVVFITSELVTQNKFELPKMFKLFRINDDAYDPDRLQPAGFVRASMAIPLFFESYYIKNIPSNRPEIQAAWRETFNVDLPPDTVRFVDGGILSNFPINLFFNKSIEIPRLPTFGIDLDDSKAEDKKNRAEEWTLEGYIGRLFNTVRFYYDKDFRLKNRTMEKGIGNVPVSEFNWLNFFLTNQEKIDLFVKGAEAATKFLTEFDWEDYKGKRKDLFKEK